MNIDIRTKTIKKLNLDNDPSKKNKLIEEILEFTDTTLSEAFRIIFQLLYGKSEENFNTRKQILHKFGFTCWKNDLPFYTYLDEDQIEQLGKELRYQYTCVNPQFLAVDNNSAYQEELTSLKNAMNEHPLLFFKAVKNCKEHATEDYVFCIEPLLSDNPYSQSYGLRKLGHNKQYCELLLPFSQKIGMLLLAMYKANKEDKEIIPEACEEQDCTEIIIEEEEICIEAIEQVENEVPADEVPIAEVPVVDEIQKEFEDKKRSDEEFWNRLRRLRKAGIDLNLLVDNEEYFDTINKLSESVIILSEALATFKTPFSEFLECWGMFKNLA